MGGGVTEAYCSMAAVAPLSLVIKEIIRVQMDEKRWHQTAKYYVIAQSQRGGNELEIESG